MASRTNVVVAIAIVAVVGYVGYQWVIPIPTIGTQNCDASKICEVPMTQKLYWASLKVVDQIIVTAPDPRKIDIYFRLNAPGDTYFDTIDGIHFKKATVITCVPDPADPTPKTPKSFKCTDTAGVGTYEYGTHTHGLTSPIKDIDPFVVNN
jgi:hypothetical protein